MLKTFYRDVTGIRYRNILQGHVTMTYYREILQRHVTVTCYRDMLQRHMTGIYNRDMLQGHHISYILIGLYDNVQNSNISALKLINEVTDNKLIG